jgi:hypothetical protein
VSLVTFTTNTSALLLHQLPPWSKAYFDVCAHRQCGGGTSISRCHRCFARGKTSAPAQRSPPRYIVVVALRSPRYSSKPVLYRGLSCSSSSDPLFKFGNCLSVAPFLRNQLRLRLRGSLEISSRFSDCDVDNITFISARGLIVC